MPEGRRRMSWDPVWEQVFRSRAWGRYPQEEVVRFIARAFYGANDRSRVRVLEIGCGPGSGASWFVAREGFRLAGIDGSPSAIEQARARFAGEGLEGEFIVGDIATLPWSAEHFDAVLDVGCLTCNDEASTRTIVAEVRRVLAPGGLHFSLTPKAGCWGDGTGERVDATTRHGVTEGPFTGLGATRFATRESLEALYAGFRDLAFEYTVRSAEGGTREVTHWIVTCRK